MVDDSQKKKLTARYSRPEGQNYQEENLQPLPASLQDDYFTHDVSDFQTREMITHDAYLEASVAVLSDYPKAVARTRGAAKAIAKSFCTKMWAKYGKHFTNDFQEFSRLFSEAFATHYLEQVAENDKKANSFEGTAYVKNISHGEDVHRYQLHLHHPAYLHNEVRLLLVINTAGEVIQIEEVD